MRRHTTESHGSGLQAAFREARYGLALAFTVSLFLNLLQLVSPIYMMQVFDRVLATGNRATLLALTAMVLAALLVLALLEAVRQQLLSRTAAWACEAGREELFDAAFRAGLATGERSAQPLRDLRQVQSFLSGSSVAPLLDAPWTPVFLLAIALLNPLLGLVALCSAAGLLGLGYLNERLTRSLNDVSNHAQLRAFASLEAMLRSMEAVAAMGMAPAVRRRWGLMDRAAGQATERAAERSGMVSGATKAARLLAQIAILGVGALLVLEGRITAGGMIAASILLGRALAPVEQAVGAWRTCVSAWHAWRRITALLARFPTPPGRFSLPAPSGRLRVEGLGYRPSPGSPLLLRNISFELEPGRCLGVVGPTGGGKTTLCRLLTGIVTPTLGIVRLDGADVSRWTREELGPHIGYLPQGVELFAGTVAENIARMGDPDPHLVIRAAQEAGLHPLILHLPHGYDTLLQEAGGGLSAGQRQRIGLARALYGRPKLVILDEPNANLDQAGDEALQDAIRLLKQNGAAVLVVSHRVGALAHADHLLVLAEGEAAAYGARDELLCRLSTPSRPAQVAAAESADAA